MQMFCFHLLEKTVSLAMIFRYHVGHVSEYVCKISRFFSIFCVNTGCSKLRWFSSPDRRSLNPQYSAFQDSYVFGHQTRTTNDQRFVERILEMRQLGNYFKQYFKSKYRINEMNILDNQCNDKCYFLVKMAIQEWDQSPALRIKSLLIHDINVFLVHNQFIFDAMI